MAARRMFSIGVCTTPTFLRMSKEAQLLYFHAGLQADDDGVFTVDSLPRRVEADPEILEELVGAGLLRVLSEEDEVYFISDWLKSNDIQADRYTPSLYQSLLKGSDLKVFNSQRQTIPKAQRGKPSRSQRGKPSSGACIQDVSKVETQGRLVKERVEKVSEGDGSGSEGEPEGTGGEGGDVSPPGDTPPSPSQEKIYFTLDFNGSEWPITFSKSVSYISTFTRVPLRDELNRMQSWLKSHEPKNKDKPEEFIWSWLDGEERKAREKGQEPVKHQIDWLKKYGARYGVTIQETAEERQKRERDEWLRRQLDEMQ